MLRTESDLERTQQPFQTSNERGLEMASNPSSSQYTSEMRMIPDKTTSKIANKHLIKLVNEKEGSNSKAHDADEKAKEQDPEQTQEDDSDEPDKEVIPRFDINGNEYPLFERYDRVLINEPVESIYLHVLKVFLAAFGLVGYLTYFKRAYEGDRWGKQYLDMRIWEDLYGRNLFFFIVSVPFYLYSSRTNLNISFFELEAEKRGLFALRLFTQTATFILFSCGVAVGQKITPFFCCLTLSQAIVRIYTLRNTPYKPFNFGKVASAVILPVNLLGALLMIDTGYKQADGTNVSKGRENFDNIAQFGFGLFAAVTVSASEILLIKTRPYIHNSIDTIYVALSLTLLMPSFALADFSRTPVKYDIDGYEVLYYFVGGVLTWLFHSQVTQLICLPSRDLTPDTSSIEAEE